MSGVNGADIPLSVLGLILASYLSVVIATNILVANGTDTTASSTIDLKVASDRVFDQDSMQFSQTATSDFSIHTGDGEFVKQLVKVPSDN